ncbi:MAG: hypothetical protein IJ946_02015 [Clostridia bacterium]|nr:hypothetical protein [Clostridia bacterium]
MTFEELALSLGVEKPVPLKEGYYPVPESRKEELCSLEMIDSMQEKYNIFAEYYEAVREGFIAIEKDPQRKAYLDSVSLFLKDATYEEAIPIRCPEPENTPATNMLPVLIHLPSFEKTYEELISRGFSHEDAVKDLSVLNIYIREQERYRTKIVGISSFISFWLYRFTKLQILYFGKAGINFHMIPADYNSPYVLRNKNSGKIVTVFGNNLPIHKSGIPLRSAGATDEEGSFIASFKETENEYIGHRSDQRYVSRTAEAFSKAEWELIVSPGDDIITLHIFWDSNLTPEAVQEALDEGVEKCKLCYPDKDFKAIRCSSWLMSPDINEILGENSKLSRFSSRFIRFPIVAGGKLVHGYVFPNQKCPPEDYVATTTLQKGVKKLLLEGKYIYETAGIIPLK